ncbi:MAG: tripartite tricarboxylate transporter permease, partial [Thermodesulfobacteriota bacterium]|nr:tripartite tricarboxylate transporter permease [Thermodesulfobacteriota bacterium]
MFEAIYQGLLMVLVPYKMLMLMIGLALGAAVAIFPGIGGTVALTIVLPFLLHMEPVAAVAMMMGIFGVMNTADSITAVLLGVPGTGGGAATIVEGHPMARKGEAARALSASFTASLIGGIIGVIALALSIPILGIIIKQFGSPEFLMLSVLGIASVSGLGGGQVKKGLISAGIGLMLAGMGGAALTPYFRYTLGMPYLYDGIPLVIVALGIFGIPEMLELVARGVPIGGIAKVGTGVWQGVKDCYDHIWLIVRCSIIGIYVGIAPGAGPSVAAWLSYAHAVSSAKKKGGFGKGDIRGLVAPECANNACRG